MIKQHARNQRNKVNEYLESYEFPFTCARYLICNGGTIWAVFDFRYTFDRD